MSSREKHIIRSLSDRRTSLDRRTINLGPKYLNHEQRSGKKRRQSWEKRNGWKSINQWSSSPVHFNLSEVSKVKW